MSSMGPPSPLDIIKNYSNTDLFLMALVIGKQYEENYRTEINSEMDLEICKILYEFIDNNHTAFYKFPSVLFAAKALYQEIKKNENLTETL